jgi:hypothetical protein
MNSILIDNKDTEHAVIEDITTRNKSVDAMIFTSQFPFFGNSLYDQYNCLVISMSPPGWSMLEKYMGNDFEGNFYGS